MNEAFDLEPLHIDNWVEYVRLSPGEHARYFLPSNLFIIKRSRFEPLRLLGMRKGEEAIGMIATYYKDTILWISHFMVDEAYQQLGFGRKALSMLMQNPGPGRVTEFRTGVISQNTDALTFFIDNGFLPMNEMPDGEIILHREINSRIIF
jgi:ribosomal protein S18 acetylase RimI-like enzyme